MTRPGDDADFVAASVAPWLDRIHTPERLTASQLDAVCVWMLEGEVANGGFHPYFSNSRGRLAVRTVEALMTIGLTRYASPARRSDSRAESRR